MTPETINSFFTPVSTETNPHQQIDDLILMSELDKIAREDMTYGAMRQYGTVEVTEAPGLGLLEWADTGPIIGMKALAGLVGKGGKDISKLHKTAKTIFGTTDDVMEAGYIVNDGSMLDFSGANVGGTHGVRAYDHRQINLIGSYGRNHGLKGFDNIEMDEFIKSGGIRIDGVMNSVNMAVMPTDAQMKRLKNFYKKYQDSPKGWYEKKNWDTGETSFKEDEFLLHLERPGAEVLEHWSDLITKRVTRDTPWEDIEKHIKKVYREGAGEESTITKIIRQFRELGRGG